jgi:hypothetical protein
MMLLQIILIERYSNLSTNFLMMLGWTAAHFNSALRLHLIDYFRRR